VYEISYLY